MFANQSYLGEPKKSIEDSSLNKKKIQNGHLLELIQQVKVQYGVSLVSDEQLVEIENCSQVISFLANYDYNQKHLAHIQTCQNRFCPLCSKMRAIRRGRDLFRVLSHVSGLGYRFIFLTLTIPNVDGGRVKAWISSGANPLREALSKMSEGWKRLTNYKDFKAINEGFYRSLEITYNHNKESKAYGTYHPHYHALIAVSPSYFRGGDYLRQKDFIDLWQMANQDEDIKIVDVRAVKPGEALFDTVLELSKYIAKDADYLFSPDVFYTFYHALKGFRAFTTSGIIKEVFTLLKDGKLPEIEKEYDPVYWFGSKEFKKIKNQYELTKDIAIKDLPEGSREKMMTLEALKRLGLKEDEKTYSRPPLFKPEK